MLFSMAPITAVANSAFSCANAGEIISFEPLADNVALQIVPHGTELSSLSIPETLMATVIITRDSV